MKVDGSRQNKGSIGRQRTVAACACIALALVFVLLLGGWGAYRDRSQVRNDLLQSEVARMRSHADRTVGHLESDLLETASRGELARVINARWLRAHWDRSIERVPGRLYAAIVDSSGLIVAHSDRTREGRTLENPWHHGPLPGTSDGAVQTSSQVLSGGVRAIDVAVPIVIGGRQVGIYHSGTRADVVDDKLVAADHRVLRGWGAVIAGMSSVVLLASVSLYHIVHRTALLEHRLDAAESRRVAERSQLVAGLAHEIRNPLNAMRLNLHTIGRVFGGETGLPDAEFHAMLEESVREIERVECLIRDLLGYAHVDESADELVDLNGEVQATLAFLKQVFTRDSITIRTRLPELPAEVRMDRGRIRQVLLNLLNNAREAAGPGGWIEVDLCRGRHGLELVVADNGPGVAKESRERVFEPFFSTKPDGMGMGLAMVRKFVEDGGGRVEVEGATQFEGARQGARFRVRLPEAQEANRTEAAK